MTRSKFCGVMYFVKSRIFQISWCSLVLYVLYETIKKYNEAPQYHYLRSMLGVGLYISRGTASVINICCALILLPVCKKINKLLYSLLSRKWPRLFFFWLERAKSFHITVGATLFVCAVIHSISHLVNLWSFSKNYNEVVQDVNIAHYKDENPVLLLLTQPGLTGLMMMMIITVMGVTSHRSFRRRSYNTFWYTHHLYLPFMALLLLHPLGGILKEEILEESNYSNTSVFEGSIVKGEKKFKAIESKTWLWMAVPLTCFGIDLMWRLFSRNCSTVQIIKVTQMSGRLLSLTLSCPNAQFECRPGQYVLLQCLDVSLIEWHPFTVVELPSSNKRCFTVWMRIVGDWTKVLENVLLQTNPKNLQMLVDGPFSSPMEGVVTSDIAVCVAAGVGITPYVALLRTMKTYPRFRSPHRIHLIWIVRYEHELSWLAKLADDTMAQLIKSNRPDRLHIELYVTFTKSALEMGIPNHLISITDEGKLHHKVIKAIENYTSKDEKETLLPPHRKRKNVEEQVNVNISLNSIIDRNFSLVKQYPLLGCRLNKGRPNWDCLFNYWTHLYPKKKLSVFCCGPKALIKTLKQISIQKSRGSNTTFHFVHEGF